MNDITLGSVVFSKAGRDSGSYYLVVEIINENFVKIADGKKRTLQKPKTKKVKHLTYSGDTIANIGAKLTEQKQVFDKEIFSALRTFNDKIKTEDCNG